MNKIILGLLGTGAAYLLYRRTHQPVKVKLIRVEQRGRENDTIVTYRDSKGVEACATLDDGETQWRSVRDQELLPEALSTAIHAEYTKQMARHVKATVNGNDKKGS